MSQRKPGAGDLGLVEMLACLRGFMNIGNGSGSSATSAALRRRCWIPFLRSQLAHGVPAEQCLFQHADFIELGLHRTRAFVQCVELLRQLALALVEAIQT